MTELAKFSKASCSINIKDSTSSTYREDSYRDR